MRRKRFLRKLPGPNQAAGFTLIELLVSLFIASIMLGLAAGFFSSATNLRQNGRIKTEAQQGLRALVSSVTQELRQAGACLTQIGQFIAIEAIDLGEQDSLTLRIGRPNPITGRCIQSSLTAVANPGTTGLQVSNAAALRAYDRVYITPDGVNGEYYTIASVSANSVTLTSPLSDIGNTGNPYPIGTALYPLDERTYAVDGSDPDRPMLTLSINGGAAQPFVDGVTTFDLQYSLLDDCGGTPCLQVVGYPADEAEWRLVREVGVKATVRSLEKDKRGLPVVVTTGRALGEGEYVNVKPRNLISS